MKILLHCCGRVGSKSFGDWLSSNLGIAYLFEPLSDKYINNHDYVYSNFFIENNIDVPINMIDRLKIGVDFVAKVTPADIRQNDITYDYLLTFFDKAIVLYRENTIEQAESLLWATVNDNWHYKGNSSDYYTIDYKFLKEHEKEILERKENYDKINSELKKLKNCLHITYEEFYYSDRGIKKVEEYLGIKIKTLPNSSDKLRMNNQKLI